MDITDLIRNKNYAGVGSLFMQGGTDTSVAVDFLERVVESLNGGSIHKKARTTESLSEPLVMNNIDTSFILNDTIDDSVVTLALQVPEDMHLTAYIIGPKGVNVINIGDHLGLILILIKAIIIVRLFSLYQHFYIYKIYINMNIMKI
jgi:hypothetical protein